jgi:hypothetical protein
MIFSSSRAQLFELDLGLLLERVLDFARLLLE